MDLFSSLPDEVLCHVLSFLTIKEAALTSGLAKRWRNLFAFVPNLDIDDSVFLHPEEGKREREGVLQSFMDFVDRVLALQGDSSIKKFSLKVKTGIDTDHVNQWICNLLQRGVSYLELFLEFPTFGDDSKDDYVLPPEMFVSKTLVEVKLRSEFGVKWWRRGTNIVLPLLRTLEINSDMIILYDHLERYLHAFPVLEELYMADVQWFSKDETASSASLKKLTIHACGFEDLGNPKSISFDTPSLVYLDYSDFVAEDYPKVNLPNLVEAQINLRVTENQIERIRAPNGENDVIRRFRNVSKLMRGIRNVQKLSLLPTTLEVLSLCCESMPVFNNLKHLRIVSDKELGWQAMSVLLRNCPHLETLVLHDLLHYETDKCGDACDCIPREDRGSSLSSCPVKTLQIQGVTGELREIELMEHFLKSFPCLKEMKVTFEANDYTNFEPVMLEVFEKILKYFKKISSCDVYFLYAQ